MARIFVTGANGFIGRELVRRLLREHEVRCGVRSADSVLPEWQGRCEVSVIGSIGPQTDWSAWLAGVDVVVHLAAIAHGKSSDADLINQVNVEGVRRLARAAQRHDLQRLVLLSSIGVHGDRTATTPFSETSPIEPYDDYSRSKCEAERVLLEVTRERGPEVVIVRPPLVYGPDAPGNFGRLVGLVRRGIPLPFGSIANRKSFVSVRNLADFLACAAVAPAAANEAFVVCDGEDVSLPELLRAMATAMDRRSGVFRFPEALLTKMLALIGRDGDLRKLSGSLVVDATKARDRLGWRPPETLAEGLAYAVTAAHN